jgi:putative acetyltransferase
MCGLDCTVGPQTYIPTFPASRGMKSTRACAFESYSRMLTARAYPRLYSGDVPELVFRVDDLTGDATRALVAHHLLGMHDSTPPENVFALDVDALRDPSVTFWSGWSDDDLVVIGALKQLDETNGELKSMRATDAARGTGAGRAILRHIVAEARDRGITTLWLETGTPDDFLPARRLYESEDFVACGPFGDYPENPFSVFMTRAL